MDKMGKFRKYHAVQVMRGGW